MRERVVVSKLSKLYWHCQVGLSSAQRDKWDAVVLDYSLDRIEAEIATPWRKGLAFFLGGMRFNPETANIRIIHTPNPSKHYIDQMVNIRMISDAFTNADMVSGVYHTLRQGAYRLFALPQAHDFTNSLLVAENESMSSARRSIINNSAHLRKILLSKNLTDSDIDAILIDINPTAKARASDGMDRQRKITLLFEHVELDEIYKYLESMHVDVLSKS